MATSAQPAVLLYRGLMKGTDKRNFIRDFSCHAMELRRYFVYAKQNVRLVSLPRFARQQLFLKRFLKSQDDRSKRVLHVLPLVVNGERKT